MNVIRSFCICIPLVSLLILLMSKFSVPKTREFPNLNFLCNVKLCFQRGEEWHLCTFHKALVETTNFVQILTVCY